MHRASRFASLALASILLLATGASTTAGQGHGIDQVATPPASPVEAAGWSVTSARPVDLDGTPVALSPDGAWLAGIGPGQQLCIWSVATLEVDACDTTPLPIYADSVTWAPDGTAVAFSLDAFRLLEESDIHVFERATGASITLTDDGLEGSIMDLSDEVVPVDVMPAWRPDASSLVFARTVWGIGAVSTELMEIDRAGGEPSRLHVVSTDAPLAIVTPMFPMADGALLYSALPPDRDDPVTGIWRLDASGEADQVVPGTTADAFPRPVIADALELDGTSRIAGFSAHAMGTFAFDAPIAFTLDLGTSALTPLAGEPGLVPGPATFAPDGSATLAVLMGVRDQVVIAGDGDTQVVVLDPAGLERTGGITFFLAPSWAASGTVLVPPGLASMAFLLTLAPAGDAAPA
jgi:hypothetical protein